MSIMVLDQGLYDAAEVAWLLGHDVEWVVPWTDELVATGST